MCGNPAVGRHNTHNRRHSQREQRVVSPPEHSTGDKDNARKQRVVSAAQQRVSERARGIDRSHLTRHRQAHKASSDTATFLASCFANFNGTKFSDANGNINFTGPLGFPKMSGCNETSSKRDMYVLNENVLFSKPDENDDEKVSVLNESFSIPTCANGFTGSKICLLTKMRNDSVSLWRETRMLRHPLELEAQSLHRSC